MGSPARQIETKAMNLPARARARLAERLIASLDEQTDRDAEQAWIREGEHRLDELRSGKVKGRSAAAVLRRARAALCAAARRPLEQPHR
jgi:putative addiction module component (TIGR02574 family)